MSKTPIIFLPLTRWDSPYSSTALSLAKEIAKDRPVFYIDNPFTLKDYISKKDEPAIRVRRDTFLTGRNQFRKIENFPEDFTWVVSPLVLPINWLPKGKIYHYWKKRNNEKILLLIGELLQTFDLKEYILINVFNPFLGFDFPDSIRPKKQVYYCVDVIAESKYIQKHGPQLEQLMIRHSDLTLTTSTFLKEYAEAIAPGRTELIPNGVDFPLFNQTVEKELPLPIELKKEKREIILYTGAIGLRLDYELLKKIAETFSEKLLVLVGPKMETYEEVGLEKLPNVRFIGIQPLEAIPTFLRAAKWAIIPFKVNELTRGIYPLKINEYLAAGKRVISTDFSPDIRSFSKVIQIAQTHYEFLNFLKEDSRQDTQEAVNQRVSIAKSNSWEKRTQKILSLIDSKK